MKKEKELALKKHVRGIHSTTTNQPIEVIYYEDLDFTFTELTPVYFAGASSTSWDEKVSVDQQEKIRKKLTTFFYHLNPSKVVIITGGTDLGLEALVHEVVGFHAKRGKTFKLLGAFAPDLEVSYETISKHLSHAVIIPNSWYDKGPEMLPWVNKNKGVAYFIGGGEVVKAEVQTARNLGAINYFLMKDIYGSSAEEALIDPKHGFSIKEGLCKVLEKSPQSAILQSKVVSPDEALHYFLYTGKTVVTFLGFSTPYDTPETLEEEVSKVLDSLKPDNTIINIGGTSMGIGVAYEIAKKRGFQTTGIVSTNVMKSKTESLSPYADMVFIIKDTLWGGLTEKGILSPTSLTIANCSHKAVAFGGGYIAKAEANAIENRGKFVMKLPFTRSKL